MTAVRRWPGRYTDRHGAQDVVFESDGRGMIRTTIRGVRFEGSDMDDLGALDGEPPETAFSFHHGGLCSCVLEWTVPLPVEQDGGVRTGALHCVLRLGDPRPPRGLDAETLTVTLRLGDDEYRGADHHSDFENALSDIGRRLPAGSRIRACVACAWSDYHPAGAPLMGGLACFRDVRDRYRQVHGKHGPHGVFAIWDELTEFVQETWLCEQFEHRGPEAGYRGSFPLQGI
ncbi:DUF6304 family protein [Streptomyces sp. NPDC005648]|uniref:DUF6304 family protein n=1 Tax=Streptomyces sp. NPDC005648 TaxID=3157044 RepID=UPI0033BE3A51